MLLKQYILKDIRWQKCNVKSTSLYANTWAKTKAKKSGGGEEAIFERNGILTEGATSNLFLVHKNKVLTPKTNIYSPWVTREL